MAKLVWDEVGSRFYETGVENGVLYVQEPGGGYPEGVVWNGLISISENPSGAETTPLYADNMKYVEIMSAEEFGATIEAYTYPEEFEKCDGSASIAEGITIGQQDRATFGLCYKTVVGNDVQGNNLGYKIHLLYGLKAAPSEKSYQTINDSPEAISFSWEVSATPVNVKGFKPTATVVIDSTKVKKENLAALEAKLFGDESTEASLPLPDEIMELIKG